MVGGGGSALGAQEGSAGDGDDEEALDSRLQLPQDGAHGRVLTIHRHHEPIGPHKEALHSSRGWCAG